jgi:hypothetical protein
MKYVSILCLAMALTVNGFSQCRKTFLYGCKLPEGINPRAVVLQVLYQGKPLQSKVINLCGHKMKVHSTFSFAPASVHSQGGKKLLFHLDGNVFYWLFSDDMCVEMASRPGRYRVKVNSLDPQILAKFDLPQTYDLISENAIYLDLLDKSQLNMNELMRERIFTLNVPQSKSLNVAKDTVLVYSFRDGLPKGIALRFLELKALSQMHSMMQFETTGMLRRGKLYLKMPEKLAKTVADGCTGKYVSLEGAVCFIKGGLSGGGCGECGMLPNEKVAAYHVEIQIEP